ncbi:MAG: hypothetical protein IT173_09080 [Acidobacteria bacterium]|nr:hypothetical protein [Acidobacteriota bacterium]
MTVIFLIFVGLVVYHFIIEGIIAPSERSKIRLKLFGLRDQVRMAKIAYKHEFDNELYDHLQAHANKSIHLLHNYNIVGLWSALRAERRKEPLSKTVAERMSRFYRLLEQSTVPELGVLHLKSLFFTVLGFIFNSLGWLPYIVIPVVIGGLTLFATRMVQTVRRKGSNLITGLLEMPEGEFRRHFPNTPTELVR